MNRLFIAEKPSLARAIAEGLGKSQKQNGFIQCGDDIVTWCYGHMLKQYDPDDYDPKLRYWSRRTLPMVPEKWLLKPKEDALTQLGIIKRLLDESASVVNAGDPDREGQLLVDEVLEQFDYSGPVERIWLASLDARSVAKALASLKDNTKYAPLRDAARARSQADWLIGLNATRAMTVVHGRESGRTGTLSQGRVQTPTLALVVNRDREISAFKPIDYFTLQADLTPARAAGAFLATFVPADTQTGLDSEGRLVDPKTAQGIADAVRGKSGTVLEVTREKKKKAVPLPHCLSSLQKSASAKFGMTAQQVLDTAQSLYEKKLTSYPRTDCRFLPVEQFSDAGRILMALSLVPGLEQVTGKANPDLKGPVWDTKKVTAHHAIIPTGETPGQLTESEQNLYLMIATAYSLQFYLPMMYEAQKIVVNLQETRWETRGRLILEPGWTGFALEDDDDAKEKEKEQSLPAVVKGDAVVCADVELQKKKTSPPSRFTEGTLIEAMANVHRFVTDAAAKATLKENEGLGTEATRAKMLETLKKRKFLTAEGKAVVSTPLGRAIIDLTPDALKDPVTTAKWESRLEEIAQGKETLQSFMAAQMQILPELLDTILSAPLKLVSGAHPCPTCGKAMARRESTKEAGHFYWGCSAYPDCKQSLPDENGKPGKPREQAVASEYPCPVCGQPLYAKTCDRGPYWGCFNKAGHPDGKAFFLPDANGKPGTPKEKAPRVVSEFACPDCKKPLLHKTGIGKDGKPYEMFSCSGYPGCKASFWGSDGKPDFERRLKK